MAGVCLWGHCLEAAGSVVLAGSHGLRERNDPDISPGKGSPATQAAASLGEVSSGGQLLGGNLEQGLSPGKGSSSCSGAQEQTV